MRKLFALLLILLVLFSPALGEAQFEMSGDDFLNRMASVFYRVRGGFNSNSISFAEQAPDGIMLEYNNSIFLSIKEDKNSRNVEHLSAVLVTQDASPARQFLKGGIPGDITMFENLCLQVIFALNPRISDAEGQRILTELGGDSLFLDGKRRSTDEGTYRYIMKLHENGMAVMVVSRIEQ